MIFMSLFACCDSTTHHERTIDPTIESLVNENDPVTEAWLYGDGTYIYGHWWVICKIRFRNNERSYYFVTSKSKTKHISYYSANCETANELGNLYKTKWLRTYDHRIIANTDVKTLDVICKRMTKDYSWSNDCWKYASEVFYNLR